MSTATRVTNWTSAAGSSVMATVTVRRDLREIVINADGDIVPTGKIELIESTNIQISINGKIEGSSYCISPAPRSAPSIVAGVVGRVAMTADRVALVEAMIAECVAEADTPDVIAYREDLAARVAQSEIEDAEYRRHVAAVDRMMSY